MHPSRVESNCVEMRVLVDSCTREEAIFGAEKGRERELVTARPGLDFLDFHGPLDHHSELSTVVANKTDKRERSLSLFLWLFRLGG